MLCRKNFAKRTGSTLDDLSEVVDTVEDGAMVSFLIADWPRNMKNAQRTAERAAKHSQKMLEMEATAGLHVLKLK